MGVSRCAQARSAARLAVDKSFRFSTPCLLVMKRILARPAAFFALVFLWKIALPIRIGMLATTVLAKETFPIAPMLALVR